MHRLQALTSLRFLAAAAIFYYHMKPYIFGLPGPASLEVSVSFFFVLSGFILTYVYGPASEANRFSTKQYFVNRFARIWPVHFVAFIVALGIGGYIAAEPQWITALINLSLLQAWFPVWGVTLSFNGPSWTISAEIFFYALCPLLIRARNFRLVYLAILAATIIALLSLEYFIDLEVMQAEPVLGQLSPGHLVIQFPFMRLLEFATGMAGCKIMNTRLASFKLGVFTWTVVELVALVLLALYVWIRGALVSIIYPDYPVFGLWLSQTSGMFVFFPFIIVMGISSGLLVRVLSVKPLVFLGEASFAIYMLHYPLIFLVVHADWVAWLGATGAALALASLVLLSACLLYVFVEKKVRAAITDWYRHYSSFGVDKRRNRKA